MPRAYQSPAPERTAGSNEPRFRTSHRETNRVPRPFERFPVGPKRTCDRTAGEIAVTVRSPLTKVRCWQPRADRTPPATKCLRPKPAGVSLHSQTTPFSDSRKMPNSERAGQAAALVIRRCTRLAATILPSSAPGGMLDAGRIGEGRRAATFHLLQRYQPRIRWPSRIFSRSRTKR